MPHTVPALADMAPLQACCLTTDTCFFTGASIMRLSLAASLSWPVYRTSTHTHTFMLRLDAPPKSVPWLLMVTCPEAEVLEAEVSAVNDPLEASTAP